jgi:hypothetical protein
VTNNGVSLSTTGSSDSDFDNDRCEGSVMRELSVLRLEEEGPCGERPQRLYFLQCLQQPLADPV